MRFKTERMLEGWGSANLSELFTCHHRNSAALNEKGEVRLRLFS